MQEMSKVCVLAHYPRKETAKQQRLRPNCAQIKHYLDFVQAFLKITRRIIFIVLPFFHELTCPSVIFAMGIVRFIWLRFLVRFSRALSYDVGAYILYDHTGFLLATERGSPYRDFAEIVRKPHSYSAIFTISVPKSHDAHAMSMRAPYDYLKSLRPYYYLNSCGVLTISVRCPYGDHAINLRCIYGLRACDVYKICQSAKLTKS